MNEDHNSIVLELRNVKKTYRSGDVERLHVLRGVELCLRSGEVVALVAPSGTGKSTLLHLAGLLDTPDEGEVVVCSQPTQGLSDTIRTTLRRDKIGFVYQFHHLLGEFTARENVLLPQLIRGISKKQAQREAERLLTMFGLKHRMNHLPGRLSGGEQQRVAIARALANAPAVLLADEPTGNLDIHTANSVFSELLEAVRQTGMAALIATHNEELLSRTDRILTLCEGLLVAR
ncbi:MAG: ABC transporter ATP-binding protein [Acetobacter sp.]|nr:ABC transporter ATP-binding protein [Acetobacter sp.]MBO6086497.1 ABC transporter ATP-binding protein [Acetobacter sp.]MBQ3818636.1 ABC transporter ATP-binding protein [Acetobacter sp.]MBQ5469852.1 ABC transporter ATP-binding protein [Acetobacter sp.]